MSEMPLIEGTRKVLKLGLPAIIGTLGFGVVITLAGFFDLVPGSLQPVHTWVTSLVETVEGPVKFLISVIAAAFAFLKFLKKDDALTETCRAAADLLFAGYAANFLTPLRKIAVKDKRVIVVAMPTLGYFGDRDYLENLKSRLGHLGITVAQAGGKGSPTYWMISSGKGKDRKTAILDVPRTLVAANTLADKVKSKGKASRKDREAAYRRLAEAFFAALDEWRKTNRYENDIAGILPEKDDDAAALAGRIAAVLKQ